MIGKLTNRHGKLTGFYFGRWFRFNVESSGWALYFVNRWHGTGDIASLSTEEG